MFFSQIPGKMKPSFFLEKNLWMIKTTRACDDILLVSCIFCINLCPCSLKYLKIHLQTCPRIYLKTYLMMYTEAILDVCGNAL